MGGSLGPSLAAARMPVAAVDAPEDFGFWAPGAWGPPGELAIPAFADVGRALDGLARPRGRPGREGGGVRGRRPRGAGAARQRRRADVHAARRLPESSEERFPRRLAGLAAMLAAGLPVRCATLSAPGAWDTHANQERALTENLSLTSRRL